MAEGGSRILPGTIERCCASSFPPVASEEDARRARDLYGTVRMVNCEQEGGPRLEEIVYRNSSREEDTRYHVFRFDLRSYPEIFERGFEALPQGDTPNETYYNLLDHVNNIGAPLDPERQSPHGFVSTTLSSRLANRNPVGTLVYRYEIYAPGGILVGPTLGNRWNFPGQRVVAFVGGIAPQYILSVEIFRIIGLDSMGFAVLQTDNLDGPYRVLNRNFRLPQYEPAGMPHRIVNPACTYLNSCENWRAPPKLILYLGEIRAPPEHSDTSNRESCIFDVINCESYIDAAFRSSRATEAYIFMRNEYVLLNYAPGTAGDHVVKGPLLICEGFPSLADTPFGDYGIDCAFKIHYKNEAFIFFDNLCARLKFAPDDEITDGPKTIGSMFPFLEGTDFEGGVDAAFESPHGNNEAYLFRGSRYAHIKYSDSEPRPIATGLISDGFPSLTDTIFQNGIGAAFTSHCDNKAYIFKERFYALINFPPGSTNDSDGMREIHPYWPSLGSILPRKHFDLDVYHPSSPAGGRGGPDAHES